MEFCRERVPLAIFVGARNLNCKALKEDMDHINNFILDAHAQAITSHKAEAMSQILFIEVFLRFRAQMQDDGIVILEIYGSSLRDMERTHDWSEALCSISSWLLSCYI